MVVGIRGPGTIGERNKVSLGKMGQQTTKESGRWRKNSGGSFGVNRGRKNK